MIVCYTAFTGPHTVYEQTCNKVDCSLTRPLSLSFLFLPPQRTKATVKIFSEPMPNSNERSIQLMGTTDQILECVHHFLEDISKVRGGGGEGMASGKTGGGKGGGGVNNTVA